MTASARGVESTVSIEGVAAEVLSERALDLLALLHRTFDGERKRLLQARVERQQRLDAGERFGFLEHTRDVREGDWTVPPAPPRLQDRRVEITGPTSAKMVINALNSGAAGFMADFEDANSPTWANMIGGQANLSRAIRGTLTHEEKGKSYELGEELATLLVRPRGWHLVERHLLVDGEPISGGMMDLALYLLHNAETLLEQGSGPFFYLPKLESHQEARLWHDVISLAEETIGLDRGTARATVLIETLPAVFEMHEILHALGPYATALNAGRWDYLFSMIKRHKAHPDYVLPDRASVTMTVPFMKAYTELLVQTCHRRGAHAMGGMSAVIPSRKDEAANQRAFDAVSADKQREAEAGYDGTWVAHPDSVPVAREQFDKVLGGESNQLDRRREEVSVTAEELLDAKSAWREGNAITEAGLRGNVNVGIQYISSWLRGNGAAAIHGLMEDAATAEIARGQIWHWIRHGCSLDDGRPITADLVRTLATEELESIREEIGDDEWFETQGRPKQSRALFEAVALGEDFVEFLTLPAYERLLELEDAR